MSGSYHIIHHHARYIEESVLAVCGKTLVKGRDDCCNISAATPDWSYDWCHDCVKAFLWNENARKLWREKHGIETLDRDSWERWLHTPKGRAVFPWLSERDGAG